MNKLKSLIKHGLERLDIEVKANPYVQPTVLQQKIVTTPNPVIFDVGAHHGHTYSDYRTRFPNANIHLVEPFPESAEILSSLTQSDPLGTLHRIGLSSSNGQKTLHVNEASATNSLNALSDGAAERWAAAHLKQKDTLTVDVKTLDALTGELNIDYIDIMKMDVQGAEMDVLAGSIHLLSKQSIGLLQFEFIAADTYENQRPMHEYLELMDSYGYTLMDFYQPLRRNGKLLQCDLLFANSTLAEVQ